MGRRAKPTRTCSSGPRSRHSACVIDSPAWRDERRRATIAKALAMRLNRILVPADFSTAGRAALETAAALARDHGAKLLVLHVQEPAVAYGGGELYAGIPEVDVEELRRQLS